MDAPHGQKVQLTINGRSEKRYVDEGSTGTSASRRRESTTSTSKGKTRNAKEMRDHFRMIERRAAAMKLHDHHDVDDPADT